jgi:ubiquinone/menaquinone biosynthesis C-methylase UbiE
VDARLQRRVQRYGWDKSAGHYEEFWQRQLDPVLARIVELARPEAGERVIDVACGTGLVSFPVAARVGSAGTVLGVDLSEKMIETARGGAAERNLDQARFERMDAEDLRVADAAYDVGICSLGLMYVPSPLKALQEMHRVLRRGGRAVASVWGQRDRCGWAEIFPIVDARVASEVCPMFFRLGAEDILHRELEAAGFAQVTTERLETRLIYSSPEDACGAAFDGGPVALAYSRFEEGVKAQARDEYLASIEPFREGEGYSVPGEFVLGIGHKA